MKRHTIRLRHTLTGGAVVILLALPLTACGGSNNANPEPPTDPASPSVTAPTSSTPSAPAWQSKYNKTQIGWYEDALKTWTTYQDRSKSIWATGKATPGAMDLFKEYFANPEFPYDTLQGLDQNHITVVRQPDILWSKAADIAGTKNTGQHGVWVVIDQCVDYRTGKEATNGKLDKPSKGNPYQHPFLRTIHLQKLGKAWMVTSLLDLEDLRSGQKVKRCGPQD